MHLRTLIGIPLSVAAGLLLPARAVAQTAVWTGSSVLTTEDWSNASNWSTGVVPNSPGSVAVFEQTTNGPAVAAAVRLFATTVDLDELRFAANVSSGVYAYPPRVQLAGPAGIVPTGSTLNLHGAGITVSNSGNSNLLPLIDLSQGSTLNFYNTATITGPTAGSGGLAIGLADASSGITSQIHFHDQSSAGFSAIYMDGFGNGIVGFHDQSSAGRAFIYANKIIFSDESTAAAAHFGTYHFGSTVTFENHAQAAAAEITIARYGTVIFADQADAGSAVVTFGSDSTGAVVIRDQAATSGLTLKIQAAAPQSTTGSLDISGAAGEVSLRAMHGSIAVNLGANNLRFNRLLSDEAMQLSGPITGSGGLIFSSPGLVTVSNANNTYAGDTLISTASVSLINGRINNVRFDQGGLLAGSGVVGGNLLGDQGRLRPLGTISVLGNFIQTPSLFSSFPTSLAIDLTSGGRLVIGGTAQVAGTLELSGAPNSLGVGSRSVAFLTAAAVSGRFEAVTFNGGPLANTAMLSSHVAYSPTAISFVVEQRPFAAVAATPSQGAIGRQLDATLGGASGAYLDLLRNLNSFATTTAVTTALQEISPDRYGVLVEQGFLSAAARQVGLDRWLATLHESPTAGRGELFFEGGLRRADFDSVVGLPGVSATADLGTVGGAWRAGAWVLGVNVSSERARGDLDAEGSRAEVESVAPGLFARYSLGSFSVNASAAFSRDDYELRRRIVYTGFDRTATAAPSGKRTDVAVNARYLLRAREWTVTPMLGLLSSRWQMDSFAEANGGAASLAFSDWKVNSLRTRAGVEIARRSAPDKLAPVLSVVWLHDFEEKREIATRFPGGGNEFTSPGRPPEKDLVQANLSLDFNLGRNTSLYGSFGGAWGKNMSVNADFSAGLHWMF